MRIEKKYFFVISFFVDEMAGIAMVIARNDAEAFQILKNAGRYNGSTSKYVKDQSLCIGESQADAFGLLIESFSGAKAMYDALFVLASKIVGPQGPQGERGPAGPPVNVTVESVESLDYGIPPTVTSEQTEDDVKLSFGIPDINKFLVSISDVDYQALVDSGQVNPNLVYFVYET